MAVISTPEQELQDHLSRARVVQQQLDHKLFQLKTLHDAIRELSTSTDPREMLNIFLLMTMGALGASKGFALVVDPMVMEGLAVGKGLDSDELSRLRAPLDNLPDSRLAEVLPLFEPPEVAQADLVARNVPADPMFYPSSTSLLIRWCMDSGCSGLFGLGTKLSGEPYSDDDVQFLLSLSKNLMLTLHVSHGTRTIASLNRDLQQRNTRLEGALHTAFRAQQELDRRVHHLKTLYDASLELGPKKDTDELVRTFLLLCLGAFNPRGGFVLLYDKAAGRVLMHERGGEFREAPDADQARKILYASLGATEFAKLGAMSAQPLRGMPPGVDGLPLEPRAAVVFRLDDDCLGLVGLGEKLTQDPYGPEELELLLTQTSNFLVFLKNVRSFETIQALNQDLEQRNRELQQTIDELTASRRKIEMLERAGAHIKAVLQRETERLQRVTALDLVLILAAGLLLGLLFNLSNPHGTAVIPSAWKRPAAVRIAPAPVRRMLETGQAVLVDARPAEFYRQRHIQGALNVPPSLFDFIYAMRFADLDLEKPVVVYGRNISSHYDEEVAFKLSSRGHQRIRILEGGLEAWEELGLPVQAQ